jgi:uncharacterized protein YjbJ (UPF0337 family)
MDKAEGKIKEAYGALTGDEAKKAEGRAQQRKAQAEEEAAQREKTRQAEAEAEQAEEERDRQRREDKGAALGDLMEEGPLGPLTGKEGLGGLTDKLTGR